MDSSENIKQKLAKKLKNWEEFVARKLIEQDKQELMNCLCIKRWILRLWVNYWLTFRIFRTKWIPCQTRNNFTILNQRAPLERPTFPLPGPRDVRSRDSGLQHDTRNTMGTSGNVFWTTTCSRRTILIYLRQFKEFGILFSRIETWYHEKFVDTCTTLPKRGWIVKPYWWNLFTQWCGRLFGIADPQLTMQWIKEVEIAKSIDDLMTSRSITGRTDFPDYDMLDAMIPFALRRLLDKHVHFWKRVSVEEQRAQNFDRFTRGRQIAYMIYKYFRATGRLSAYWTNVSDLFNMRLHNDDKLYFPQVICLQMWSWKDCTSQNYKILFSFRVFWLCTLKKPFEIMGKQVVHDWRHL